MEPQVAVILYDGNRTSPCEYCDKAETIFLERGYELHKINIREGSYMKLFKALGARTVPQIFCNGRFIGGYTNLLIFFGSDRKASEKLSSNMTKRGTIND
jgi:glutaredoxin